MQESTKKYINYINPSYWHRKAEKTERYQKIDHNMSKYTGIKLKYYIITGFVLWQLALKGSLIYKGMDIIKNKIEKQNEITKEPSNLENKIYENNSTQTNIPKTFIFKNYK